MNRRKKQEKFFIDFYNYLDTVAYSYQQVFGVQVSNTALQQEESIPLEMVIIKANESYQVIPILIVYSRLFNRLEAFTFNIFDKQNARPTLKKVANSWQFFKRYGEDFATIGELVKQSGILKAALSEKVFFTLKKCKVQKPVINYTPVWVNYDLDYVIIE